MVLGNYLRSVACQIWWMKAMRITPACIWSGVDIHVVRYSHATLPQPVTLISEEPVPCFDSPVYNNNSAGRSQIQFCSQPGTTINLTVGREPNSKRDSDTFAEIHPAFSQRADLDGDQLWAITRTTIHVPTDAVAELVEPTRNVWICQNAKFRQKLYKHKTCSFLHER